MKYILIILSSLTLFSLGHGHGTHQHKERTWTSKEGLELKAVLTEINEKEVTLRDQNGKKYRFDSKNLIKKDQEIIETYRKELIELEKKFQAPGKRKAPEELTLRLCRLAIDISSNCLNSTFRGSEKNARAAADRILAELNRVWIPEVGIQFEIANLEIRTDPETDPYQETREPGALMGISRRENKKHDYDVVIALCANAAHGGGLGGGRGVWIAWGGDAWDLLHHECSHAFGTGHGHGWPFEHGTMNIASQGSRYPRERRHKLNYKEIEIIRENSKNLKEIPLPEENVKPYANLDQFEIPPQKKSSNLSQETTYELFLDPLANDYDLNRDTFSLTGIDKKSQRGAKLSILKDNRVRYQLDNPFSNYLDYDFFHYTIADENGLESKGAVILNFSKGNRLVQNGDFAKGKRNWKFDNSSIVENGEAPTSIKVDQRALLQPGGSITQKIELSDRLSEKYLLEAVIYCGPERNKEGQVVSPKSKPELTIGLFSDRQEAKRKVSERDTTFTMPFRLQRSSDNFELRITNDGEVPVRVGHVLLMPVD